MLTAERLILGKLLVHLWVYVEFSEQHQCQKQRQKQVSAAGPGSNRTQDSWS
jgi:hypothetical protein